MRFPAVSRPHVPHRGRMRPEARPGGRVAFRKGRKGGRVAWWVASVAVPRVCGGLPRNGSGGSGPFIGTIGPDARREKTESNGNARNRNPTRSGRGSCGPGGRGRGRARQRAPARFRVYRGATVRPWFPRFRAPVPCPPRSARPRSARARGPRTLAQDERRTPPHGGIRANAHVTTPLHIFLPKGPEPP